MSHDERKAGVQDRIDMLNRRTFLQILGGSFAALSLAGCDFRPPREEIVPFLEQPEGVTPGLSLWYASTCAACPASCGLLVKNRDGRPIKLEGNPLHPLSLGGLCARGQASVLDLYDSERFQGPRIGGKDVTWEEIDREVRKGLDGVKERGKKLVILSTTITSPTLLSAIETFKGAYPNTEHVTYDPLSAHGILEAHARTHGRRVVPWYRFEKARVIVAFDADFLGTWLSPVEFTKGWAKNRKIDPRHPTLSWHAQFEPRMSVTGANADLRVPLRPSEIFDTLVTIARRIAEKLGRGEERWLPQGGKSPVEEEILEKTVDRLIEARGRSLVVCGVNDVDTQLVVNAINHLLDNYGETIDLRQPSLQYQGNDERMRALIEEMARGEVGGMLFLDANPLYDHPEREAIAGALAQIPFTLSFAGRREETAGACTFLAPDDHPLERWGDAHPHFGVYTLLQPTIAPLYDTRSAITSLLAWSGVEATAYDALRRVWREKLFVRQEAGASDFETFWTNAVRDGVFLLESERLPLSPFEFRPVARIRRPKPPTVEGFELVVFAGVALGDGRQANNPWLQELPDPIARTTWGNHAAISPASARRLGVVEGRVVRLASGGKGVELPVRIEPGMPEGVVAVALGYGRKGVGRIAANLPVKKFLPIEVEEPNPGGVDLYPFLAAHTVTLTPLDRIEPLAKTQGYDYQVEPMTGKKREIVRETTLSRLEHPEAAPHETQHEAEADLWPEHAYPGHKWGMAIDLNACTGCAACVVSCQAENNVPVVGKVEVRKNRAMHWIRIDRYYSGSEEAPEENPHVAFLPMLCQHCDHAPCETVCPVLATLHSSEGLNMQVYNRCVGTRYCANNCPYKVRRFNWFDYAHDDLVQNLVLNPDITVRSRGVMEKCSFCIQRIAEAKRNARGEGRDLIDGDVKTACMESCPSDAIVFGDVNNPNSRIARLMKDPRRYGVLTEIGTK
ncbi:MAG: 4Fe-4S dicluster domain-containing protein, partial [Deltaproteobacteria bacterium]